MILKYYIDDNNNIKLEKYEMVDISNDIRSKILNKNDLTQKSFQIHKNIFFIKQDFFIHMANIIDKPNAKSLYIKYPDNIQVVIIPNNSYVFFQNKSIEPNNFELPISTNTIKSMFSRYINK
jgi:hypothetical protein